MLTQKIDSQSRSLNVWSEEAPTKQIKNENCFVFAFNGFNVCNIDFYASQNTQREEKGESSRAEQ
jgi:hypothetical protein